MVLVINQLWYHRVPHASTSACSMCFLARRVWDSSVMLLGLLGKQRLTVKFLHTNSNAQATKITFFSDVIQQNPGCYVQDVAVGFWLGFGFGFKLILELLC